MRTDLWAGRSVVDRESRTLEAPGSNPGQSTTLLFILVETFLNGRLLTSTRAPIV